MTFKRKSKANQQRLQLLDRQIWFSGLCECGTVQHYTFLCNDPSVEIKILLQVKCKYHVNISLEPLFPPSRQSTLFPSQRELHIVSRSDNLLTMNFHFSHLHPLHSDAHFFTQSIQVIRDFFQMGLLNDYQNTKTIFFTVGWHLNYDSHCIKRSPFELTFHNQPPDPSQYSVLCFAENSCNWNSM